MSPAAVVLVVLTAAAFLLLLLWAIGRAVTAMGERAYLSHDGAIMLADPMLGGNAACEPATTVTGKPASGNLLGSVPPDNS